MKLLRFILPVLIIFTARAENFTIAVIPDTQTMAEKHPESFNSATAWIASQVKDENIKLFAHLGDMVQTGAMKEWEVASEAMDLLKPHFPTTPITLCYGNHDVDENGKLGNDADSKMWRKYFGKSIRSKYPWFGGSSDNDLNHYCYLKTKDREFLVLDLEWDTPMSAIDWANGIIKKHTGMPTMLFIHAYIQDVNPPRGPLGKLLWPHLIKCNNQIFLTVNGHYFKGKGSKKGAYHQISKNDEGNDVIEMLVDYQYTNDQAWQRLLRFKMDSNEIEAVTYSPVLKKFKTDLHSKFTIPMDFNARFGGSKGSLEKSGQIIKHLPKKK